MIESYELPALTDAQLKRLSAALDDGRLRVMPAAFWASFSTAERGAFCVAQGCYVLPTVELIEHLRTVIDGRRAIEIGAGNGVVAEALDILATDSYQQTEPLSIAAIVMSAFFIRHELRRMKWWAARP